MDTYEGRTYTISTSLNERTIYLKIIDTIQYLNYEGNIELKEFRMPITLQDAYTLVKNCFSGVQDHSVSFSKNTNVLRLDFKAKVGGYMNIGFEFILRETAIEKGTMQMIEIDRKHKKEMCDIMERIDKMEHHYDSKIESLEAIIEKQGNMIEIFGNLLTAQGIPINSECVELTSNPHLISLFKIYYKCKRATISHHYHNDLNEYKNNNVEELLIYIINNNTLNSLVGLSNMPNLKILNITINASTIFKFKELISVLSSYNHTIIQLNITEGSNKQDSSELKYYCKKNNIDLTIQ